MMARLTVVWVQHFSKRFTQVVSYLILETLCGLPNYCYYFKVKKLGLQEVKSLALPPQLDLEVLDIKLRACDYKISALSFTQPFFCETVCYSILTPTLTPPPPTSTELTASLRSHQSLQRHIFILPSLPLGKMSKETSLINCFVPNA